MTWDGVLVLSAQLRIEAPPDVVRAVFLDWTAWPGVFPKIHAARAVGGAAEDGTVTIEVDHDQGVVRNWLRPVGPDRVDLQEEKRRYQARFVNHFLPDGPATRYVVDGHLEVPRWAVAGAPLLRRYGRRQLLINTLRPLRVAALASVARTTDG